MNHTPLVRTTGTLFDRISGKLSTLVRSTHSLEKEEVFELLYNPRRRYTLQLLAQTNRAFSMQELVERIAAKENDIPVGELKRQQRRRVHVSLYQTHLPLLDETNAIEYNHPNDRIAPGPALRELLPYLDISVATIISWQSYYLWIFIAYVGLGPLLVGPIGMASPFLLALGASVLFVLLALVHGFSTGDGTVVGTSTFN